MPGRIGWLIPGVACWLLLRTLAGAAQETSFGQGPPTSKTSAEAPAKPPAEPGVPSEAPGTGVAKPSGEASPKSSSEPPVAAGPRRVEQSPLPLYWLKDKQGNLVPVPGFGLEEFEALLTQKYRLEQTDQVPPFSLQAMSVTGAVKGELAELTVRFRFLVREETWVRVPLRLDQAVLRGGARYRGPGQQSLQFENPGEGYVSWVRGGLGQEHEVTLDVLVPLVTAGDQTRLKLVAPRATISEMKLTIPEAGIVAQTTDGATLLPVTAGPGGASSLSVLGIGGDFELSWRKGTARSAQTQTVLEVTGTILVKADGQGIHSVGKLTVQSRGGMFDSFRVRLPRGADLLPADYSGYTVAPVASAGPGTEDRRVVEVRFPRKLSGPVGIQLTTRIPADKAKPGGWWELGGYEVLGTARQSGHLAVAAGPQWQLLFGPPHGVRQIDELPDSPRHEESAAGFECFTPSFSLPVQVLPRKTRVSVDPEYLLLVDAEQVTLKARLKYRLQPAEVKTLTIDLAKWTLDAIEPESLAAGAGVPDPSGVLSIPVSQRLPGPIELTLRARQRIPANAKSISIELPRPQSDVHAPATVVVLPADDVELTPTPEAIVGLARQQVAPSMELPVRQQAPLLYRGDPAKAVVFAAGFAVRPQKIAVVVESRIALDEQKAQVEQRLAYTISHKPLERLAVDVPAELVGSESLKILLDEKPLAPSGLAAPNGGVSPAGPLRHQIALPTPQIGPCVLTIRYSVEMTRLLPKTGLRSAIPLVMPADGELSRNRVLVTSKEGIRVQPREGSWTSSEVVLSRNPRRHGLELSSGQRAGQLVLDVHLEDQSALGTTVANRAWVQTWLTRGLRQDRAVFCLTSTQRSVELVVPTGVNPGDVEVWLDAKPVTAQATPEGRLVVPLSADGNLGQYRLEAMYRFPGPRAAPGLLSLELPRLGRDASVQRMYWQLVLPPKEHVVEPPASFSGEFSWGWNGLFWGRKPLLEQRQLERWCGARELADVAGDANRYLFSTLGPVSRCEVRTAMRPLIVMGASGIALVLGLLLIYVPALRHPAVMLVGAVLVGGAAILYPEPALLLGQAASLGVVLTILAGLLQRGVVRHRVIPPQEVSSSIIERSSTQTHYRPPAAGGEPPTETTAAAVPAPASGPQP